MGKDLNSAEGRCLGFGETTAAMRLVTWNCRVGAFRRKASHVAPLRPDILVVQEVEPIDGELLFDGDLQPTYRDRIGDPAFPRRGIGMFSYTHTTLGSVDAADPVYCFRRYQAKRGDVPFQVVGVWTVATKPRGTSYRQAHLGLQRHADWIRQLPTVVLGDFNANASFKGSAWRQLIELVEALGLKSAYHGFFAEEFGAETRPTHFHKGKEGAPFHLDYCFLPSTWVERIIRVEVGTHTHWHRVSDHAPLVVDLEL